MGPLAIGLSNAAAGATVAPGVPTPPKPANASFSQVVEQFLADANAQQLAADHAVNQLAAGQTDNLHNVMLAVAKADLSLRTVLEIRNRISEAYQEIMRMQV